MKSKLIFAAWNNNANMTYKVLVCILTVFFSLWIQMGKAQSSETYRGYIGLSAGISFPLSDLKNDDVSDGQSLFAENAFSLNLIDLSFYFSRNVGARVQWSSANFGFNRQSFETQVEAQNNAIRSMTDPNVSQRLFLVGPCYLFRFNKLELELRAMVGRSQVEVDEYAIYFSDTSTSRASGSESSALALGIGSTISYFITNHIVVNSRIGFTNAKHKLYSIIYDSIDHDIRDAISNNQASGRDSQNLNISSIEVGFGVGYWFAERK